MSEYSFPVPEEPMPAKDWPAVTKGIGNGILDEGGFPYRLKNLNNATNTAVLQAADLGDNDRKSQAILEGFYHKIDADMTIELPAVTATTTYYIVLSFDPIRGTEQGVPVKAEVLTSLDYTERKNYLHLYEVTRQPNQLLTEAAVRMVRPRVAPVMVYASASHMPEPSKTLWGTLAVVHNGREGDNAVIYMAMTGDVEESVNGWFWKVIYDPNADDHTFDWSEKADTGTYTNPGHGFQRAIGRRGKARKMRGRVSLVSGNAFQPGNDYLIFSGSLDSSDSPRSAQSFITACGNATPTFANVNLNSAGELVARVSAATYWISLDNVSWEAR